MTKQHNTCSFNGCTNMASTPGAKLCGAHQMQRSRGQALKPLRVRDTNGHDCVFPGCENPRYGADFCNGHRHQKWRGVELSPLNKINRVVSGQKRCSKCSEIKPTDDYYKKVDGYSSMCKPCTGVYRRSKHYGISWDEAVALKSVTSCGSCGHEVDPSSRDHHIDHCHDTNAIRGVLCHGCNTALGLLGEDPERIRALAEYIERHRVAVA